MAVSIETRLSFSEPINDVDYIEAYSVQLPTSIAPLESGDQKSFRTDRPSAAYPLRCLQSAVTRSLTQPRADFRRRSDRISEALIGLHWLRVPERIRSKVAVLVYTGWPKKVSHHQFFNKSY